LPKWADVTFKAHQNEVSIHDRTETRTKDSAVAFEGNNHLSPEKCNLYFIRMLRHLFNNQ